MDLQTMKWELEQAIYKAERIGKYNGASTTTKYIPSDLYDTIMWLWASIQAVEPTYTRKQPAAKGIID